MNPTKRRPFPKVDPPLLTYDEAALRMGCSATTVRRLAKDGTLPVVRPRPTIVRISRAAIDAFLIACTTGGE